MKKVQLIAQAIYDKKGLNVLALDVKGFCSLTDFFVVAEGTSDRHVQALAKAVIDAMGKKPLHKEGLATGQWVVLDYGEVVVHLFIPSLRHLYKIEEVWKQGQLIELELNPNQGSVKEVEY